jgi:hypothetical protein
VTDVALLWMLGLACLIVALIGKSVTIGNVELPETAEKKARAGMALVGSIALVLGSVLFIDPNGNQQPSQAVATMHPTPMPSQAAPSTDRSQPVASASVASTTPSPSQTPRLAEQRPFYLSTLTGTIDQSDVQAAAPENGSWQLGTRTYPHSLGYSADNNLCDWSQKVTYTLPGSYLYLVAAVGVSDIPSDGSGQGVAVRFEVDDGSGNQLGAQSAEYGQPAQMRVNIQGATTLTLITSSTQGCFGSGSTVAVWGDAELLS